MPEQVTVISMIIPHTEAAILVASQNGYGKRTQVSDFPVQGRGGQGVIAIQTSDRNGSMVAAVQVDPQDEVMLITDKGTLVRTRADEISIIGRNTQGVRLINLSADEKLSDIQRIEEVAEVNHEEPSL
jgi:DNA gyrase subunit A